MCYSSALLLCVDQRRCLFCGHVILCLGGICVSSVEWSALWLGTCGVIRCCECGVLRCFRGLEGDVWC